MISAGGPEVSEDYGFVGAPSVGVTRGVFLLSAPPYNPGF